MKIATIALLVIGCPLISFSQAPALDELRSYPNVRDWTMSDDGAEVFFTLQSSQQHISILAGMKKDRKGRIREFKLPFSGKYNDLEPFLRPDGLRLYFVSNRPESGEGPAKKDFDIWYVERPCRTCEWSDPVNIGAPVNTPGDEFYPIVTKNNHLYFTSTYEHGKGKDDIFMSAFSGGQYQAPVSLPGGINTEGYEFNAFVAPDESFLIFSGYNRPDGMGHGDLYISFNTSGVWSQAVNLGKAFNSPQLDYCPYYDAARQMLYFTSNRSDVVIGEKDELAQILSKLSSYSNGTSRIYKVPFLTTAIQAMLDAQKN